MSSYQFIIRGYDKEGALECSLAGYTSPERQIARARALLAHDPIIERVEVLRQDEREGFEQNFYLILNEKNWQ